MSLKISLNYSPNFNSIKRKKNKVKFLIIHYTGMRSEKGAIKRLTKIQSQVSAHYFIKKNGEIIRMVPELYNAWHAGVSHWASSSSNGMHSTATDTMLVWASWEEVVVMAIFSSTRPARGGSVATPQRCSRATTRRRR